jgi:hypothetical protein
MGARGEAYATELRRVTNDLERTLEGMSDAAWEKKTGPEGWPAGVAAHHLAESAPQVAGLVQMIAQGQDLPPLTQDMLDQMNAQHAAQFAGCDKQETIRLLDKNTTDVEQILRGLSDEQVDKRATFFGQTINNQWMIENILIGHVNTHAASIAGVIAGS